MNEESAVEATMLDANLDIQKLIEFLPHRYPFLLVDRVTGYEKDARIEGIKNVTFNEPFFQGHFPGKPVMPGVLIIEALAQLSGLILLKEPEDRGKIGVFLAVDNARFRRMVIPGDQLHLVSEVIRLRRGLLKVAARAEVDGEIACQAELMFKIVE